MGVALPTSPSKFAPDEICRAFIGGLAAVAKLSVFVRSPLHPARCGDDAPKACTAAELLVSARKAPLSKLPLLTGRH
jgi:hypothetical protein